MAETEGGRRRRVVVDSLGWITESSIMPKRHRSIEGVGAGSILELKANLYKSQEETKASRQLSGSDLSCHRAKKTITQLDLFSAKNPGVDSRAYKDKLELKAVNDGSASYAALEKKAELYDKLVKGELSDEEDKEKYCVDFFNKGLDYDPLNPQDQHMPVAHGSNDGESEPDASMQFTVKFVRPGQTNSVADNDEHKRFVREVHEEANEARQQALELRARRREQAAAHREKLKQAYLRKKLEKLKAAALPIPKPTSTVDA